MAVRPHQHVLQLEVAVEDAAPVDVVEPVA